MMTKQEAEAELLRQQTQYDATRPPHRVVGITEHKGILFVATEHYVYALDADEVFRPMRFVHG